MSSDYTCLVPCFNLLSPILSSFWLMEALFQSKHSVFRSIAHCFCFFWWDHSEFEYWAESQGFIKVCFNHISGIEWKGQITSTTQGTESQSPWSQKIRNMWISAMKTKRDERGSWLLISLLKRSPLAFVVRDPCNWSVLVNDPWFNVVWRPQIPAFSTTLISKSRER